MNILAGLTAYVWVVVSLAGGAKVVAHFGGGFSYESGLIFMATVTLAYMWLSGFRGVILTDLLQAVMIVALLAVIAWRLFDAVDMTTVWATQSQHVDGATVAGFLLVGLLGPYAYADRYQLAYAARSERVARWALMLPVIPMFLVAMVLLAIGLLVRMHDTAMEADLVFLSAMTGYLPASLMAVAVVMMFASIMSSLDTLLYALASHIALRSGGELGHARTRLRITLVVMVALAAIPAWLFPSVVALSIFAVLLAMILALPMIYLFAGGRKLARFYGGIIGGCIGLAAGLAWVGINPPALLPLLAAAGMGLLIPWPRRVVGQGVPHRG